MKRESSPRLGLLILVAFVPRGALLVVGALQGRDLASALPLHRHGSFWPCFEQLAVASARPVIELSGFLALSIWAFAASTGPAFVADCALVLGVSQRTAWATGLVCAFYPYFVSTALYQPDVGVTIAVAAAAVWSWLRFVSSPRPGRLLVLVLTSVVLVADRPHAVTLCIGLSVLLLADGFPRRVSLRWRAVAVLALVATLGLYASGRYAFYGRFGVLTDNGGFNLLIGHNRYTLDYLRRYDVVSLEAILQDHVDEFSTGCALQEPKCDAELRRRAAVYAIANPGRTVLTTGLKIVRYFDVRLENAVHYSMIKNLAYSLPYGLAVLFAICFSATRAGHSRQTFFIWFVIFAYAAAGFATLPLIRMRMHTEPFMLILSVQGAARLWGDGRRRWLAFNEGRDREP